MRGSLKVEVSKDMMSAKAKIESVGGEEISYEYVLEKLEEYGIKSGVLKDEIKAVITGEMYNIDFVVAKGKPATKGKDGYYQYFVDVEKKPYKPRTLEDGTVDYSIQRELVNKGQLLAKYHPAEPGFFGYTVFASVLAPVPSKNLPALHMNGVEKNDEDEYYAKCNGEVILRGDTLSVDEELTIEGDATNITGEITYTGNIHVKGDVLAGTVIKADGEVLVDGVVEGAYIQAGKDIFIKKGIHGKGKGHIVSAKSIMCGFIEEARIEAGENITFNDCLNSNITAKKDIIGEGKLGSFFGGTAIAGNSIKLKTAGNDTGSKTILIINDNENQGYFNPNLFIAIEKQICDGAHLVFGDMEGVLRESYGEYHREEGQVRRYAIGTFKPHEFVVPEKVHVKPTILLVDDEPIIIKTFYSYLNGKYNVAAVTSAKDAFAFMENVVPDLVLLDYNMPKMDGAQMLEQMRHMSWKQYNDVPVMFATAVTDRAVVAKCLSLYPQGYLIKPLEQNELLEVVDKFFSERE